MADPHGMEPAGAPLRLRPLHVADTGLLAEMHRLAFLAPWDRAWTARSFADILAMPGTFGLLAARGDEPVGFGIVLSVAGEAELLLLATLPPYRRTGIAGRLLDAMEEESRTRGATRLLLEVAASNSAAIAFYQGAGFAACGLRRTYYPDGSDAIVLDKKLPLIK